MRISGHDLNDENLQSLNESTPGGSTQQSGSKMSANVSVTSTKTPLPGVAKWQALSKSNQGGVSDGSRDSGRYVGYDSTGTAHVKSYSTTESVATGKSKVADASNYQVQQPRKFAKAPKVAWKTPVPEYKGGKSIKPTDSDDDDDDDDDYFTI